ncbi:hypothetical protein CK203_116463 [Vitis vinifera]|uniref:Uncharacterized protein n=1 Tax=Vitis vinifera TaxID=29760 RepID=A0A438CUK5_VITVI|nr:hypothetical protein CK203_116463 [Vitis vinifera]
MPFHSELYFDIEAMRQQLELQDLFGLLQSIDGCQGILETRHNAEALHIPYQPKDPEHFRQWISKGFYFGPHHLIMAVLLYFEEKVHRKKLQRADSIPLLFLRLLCHILEHMGYPIEPHLERRHHCREHFTLDQWT